MCYPGKASSKCESNTIPELVEDCEFKCGNGNAFLNALQIVNAMDNQILPKQ